MKSTTIVILEGASTPPTLFIDNAMNFPLFPAVSASYQAHWPVLQAHKSAELRWCAAIGASEDARQIVFACESSCLCDGTNCLGCSSEQLGGFDKSPLARPCRWRYLQFCAETALQSVVRDARCSRHFGKCRTLAL